MHFVSTYVYFIALCLLVSLTVFSKSYKKEVYLKLFPPFLLVALIVEILTGYMASKGKNNVAILNFFTVFEFCFYLLLLSYIITNARIRKVTRTMIWIYAVVSVGNILFYQGMKTPHTITYSLGCLLIVSGCIYYFLELFRIRKSGRLW